MTSTNYQETPRSRRLRLASEECVKFAMAKGGRGFTILYEEMERVSNIRYDSKDDDWRDLCERFRKLMMRLHEIDVESVVGIGYKMPTKSEQIRDRVDKRISKSSRAMFRAQRSNRLTDRSGLSDFDRQYAASRAAAMRKARSAAQVSRKVGNLQQQFTSRPKFPARNRKEEAKKRIMEEGEGEKE